MIVEQSKAIVAEVNKALIGKQEVVEQALMAILYVKPPLT